MMHDTCYMQEIVKGLQLGSPYRSASDGYVKEKPNNVTLLHETGIVTITMTEIQNPVS